MFLEARCADGTLLYLPLAKIQAVIVEENDVRVFLDEPGPTTFLVPRQGNDALATFCFRQARTAEISAHAALDAATELAKSPCASSPPTPSPTSTATAPTPAASFTGPPRRARSAAAT